MQSLGRAEQEPGDGGSHGLLDSQPKDLFLIAWKKAAAATSQIRFWRLVSSGFFPLRPQYAA